MYYVQSVLMEAETTDLFGVDLPVYGTGSC